MSILSGHWQSQGWDVTVVTIAPVSRDFYEIHPNVRRVALELDQPSKGLINALGNNRQRLLALRAVIRELKPDIAIGMMPSASCTLFLAALGTSVPIVGCERTYPPAERLGRAWHWLRRILYSRMAAIVTQTQQTADWVRSCCAAHKIAVIPNMVMFPLHSTLPNVPVRSSGPQEHRSKLLLAVGRLRPEKGFDRLIKAFAQLSPDFPDWRLCVLGDGPSRNDLAQLTQRLSMEEKISMPGIAGNVGEWYEAADLFVLTSVFEGFPNALLEAMAYGLPVVSVDCDTGPRDIVSDGVDGILVPQDNSAALVSALQRLMDDDVMRAAFAAKATRVRERFSMKAIVRQWELLLEEIAVDRTGTST